MNNIITSTIMKNAIIQILVHVWIDRIDEQFKKEGAE